MTSIRLWLFGGLALVTLLTCGDATADRQADGESGSGPPESAMPPGWCAPPNTVIDRNFAMNAARASFGPWGTESDAKAEIVYVDQEGAIIRVLSNVSVGGGGLAWVDAETGCAVRLRRYE